MLALAEALRSIKQYPEAEDCFKTAIQAQNSVFGPSHTTTALTLNSLASLYTTQGRFVEAKPLTERANDIFAEDLLKMVVIKDLDSGTRLHAPPPLCERKEVYPHTGPPTRNWQESGIDGLFGVQTHPLPGVCNSVTLLGACKPKTDGRRRLRTRWKPMCVS